MTRTPATPDPTTLRVQQALFRDEWEVLWFIDEWIVGEEPSHPMPWELEEQRPSLGPILVRSSDEDEDAPFFGDPVIYGEVAFIDANLIADRLEAAYAWIRETAARDIRTMVVGYRLAKDGRSFASLIPVAIPWLPSRVLPGLRFHYEGVAYPLPFCRGVQLDAHGEFEIVDVLEGDQAWLEVRNIDDDEHLFVTDTLLCTATFANRSSHPDAR